MAEKKIYIVKSPLSHDMERYEVDDLIELEPKAARPLVSSGVIEISKEPVKSNPPADPPPADPPVS